MSAAQLRIGDADREAAAHDLGEHYAHGRISADEHAERLDRIWAARTASELGPVFADLPRLREPAPTAGPFAGRRPGWVGGLRDALLPAPFLLKVLLAIVLVVLVISHLPLLVIALLFYVLCVRRVRRTALSRRAGYVVRR